MAREDVVNPKNAPSTSPTSQKSGTGRLSRILLATNGITWLAIVSTLMVFNCRGHVIASSFDCLFRTCRYELWETDDQGLDSVDRNFAKEEAQRLASLDGNILNVLQVAAKLLELWFFFIAGTLVYNLSMMFARQHDGLPLNYLDLHIKIAGAHQVPLRPDRLISDWLKDGSIWIPCRRVLDQLLSQFLRYQLLAMLPWDEQRLAAMEKPFLSGFYNLRGGPEDATGALLAADDGETYSESLRETYVTSIDVGFRKQGPALGLSGSCLWGNVSILSVANDMSVCCYTFSPQGHGFPLSDPHEGLSTKCIRVGHGWPDSRNDHAQFFIHRTNPLINNASETASIDFYSVSSSIFLNSTTRHCRVPVANPSNPPCDWNALFAEPPPSKHRITSMNQLVLEYGYWNNTQDQDTTRPTAESNFYSAMWCNSAPHLAFGTYEFDVTQRIVNETGDTRLAIDTDLERAEPLYIHPDWLLASWEVGHSETVSANMSNPAAVYVLEFLRDAATIQAKSRRTDKMSSLSVSDVHVVMMASVLTIIDYDELLLNDTTTVDKSLGPVLEDVLTSEMWVYNLSSRTRVLGFAVAAVGCVIAGLGVGLSLAPWPFTTQPDTLGLFREALAQHSKEALGHSSAERLGWLPYRIAPRGDTRMGKYSKGEEEERHAK
ncbi:hypothetical protein C8A01DRAFT_34686 [Parachaetomium inaequale]|uniref:Uncharacterized protein n=1 Tax=Parachaetomium inaequale TaxID=2588326 RepID=A0AAN6PHV9_9PEZI|nr:hypothetical protein C8A01DRAFT_34686 [Parachaetomium inaequale]